MQNLGEWEYPYEEMDNIPPTNSQLKMVEKLMVNQSNEMQAKVTLFFIQSPSYLGVLELISELRNEAADN
jgi:hypothetical protein